MVLDVSFSLGFGELSKEASQWELQGEGEGLEGPFSEAIAWTRA